MKIKTKFFQPLALLLFAGVMPGSGVAWAGTISVSFDLINQIKVNGVPTMANPGVPTVVTGMGAFSSFGAATLIAPGILTFGPQGPISFAGDFTFSFSGRLNDTLSGTIFVNASALGNGSATWTILSGTGSFAQATGQLSSTGVNLPPAGPGQPPRNQVMGSGEINAPGLNEVPEPSTITLLGCGLTSLTAMAAARRRQQS